MYTLLRDNEPDRMSKEVYVEIPERTPLAVASRGQRSPRWSARRRRDAWFLLGVLLLGVVTLITLAHGGASSAGQAHGTQSVASPVAGSLTQPPTTSAITSPGHFREYPLPQSDSQVMRLAIDHEGRVWFGEMGRNYLAVFDPRTRTFEQMTPPHGRYGMMGMQVAPDNTIWFAEQYANYIGHYFPATGRFQLYPLPRLTIPDPSHAGKTLSLPSAPNDLALDAHGMVWFTELSINHVGRLDPATGRIRYFPVPGPKVSLMEIASDAHGTIWVTAFSSGLLLRLDPRTGRTAPYYASLTGKDPGGLYGLVVAPSGDVWVTILAENVIARLDVAAKRFIYYRIPASGSEPLAMVLGTDHALWFIEIDT